ncbi:MAG: Na+/H+ antiporter NhaA [Acidimicrobiia bacterium]
MAPNRTSLSKLSLRGGGPLRAFLTTELAGGVVLLVATIAALVWANSPWHAGYETLWHTVVDVGIGAHRFELDLREWVNDGLMAIFFLVVGVEIKRELVHGELRDPRRAALPVLAAVGGMVVPAILYAAINVGGDGAEGWAIPMATDIAFALGVLALVAPRAPSALRLFLLTLAIVDDIGAIVVIAVFYSSGLHLGWLLAAVGALLSVYLFRRNGLHYPPIFVVLGVFTWFALHESGVHATLAGVAMGLLAPAAPLLGPSDLEARADELLDVSSPRAAKATTQLVRQSISRLEWLEYGLHPWSSLLIVPLFALANAGVRLGGADALDSVTSSVATGVVVGLVVGKLVGITGAAWLACHFGVARRDPQLRWLDILGVAALGGIGFTVSLFITELAFDDARITDQAKLGILAASVLASMLGALVLRSTGAGRSVDGQPA